MGRKSLSPAKKLSIATVRILISQVIIKICSVASKSVHSFDLTNLRHEYLYLPKSNNTNNSIIIYYGLKEVQNSNDF